MQRKSGERRKLNFGHTLGHAIEKIAFRHGEAVSAGMVLASELSVKRGYLRLTIRTRHSELLEKYGLPVRLQFNGNEVLEAIRMDKKREGDHYLICAPQSEIGNAYVEEIAIRGKSVDNYRFGARF